MGSLLQEENIYKLLFETASESLVVTNKLGIIQKVNPRTIQMFGYSEEELIHSKLEILIPEGIRKKHVEHRNTYMQNPSRRFMGEGRHLTAQKKSGEIFPVEVSLNFIKKGEETLYVALVTDITLRKKHEDQIVELNKLLEKKIEQRTAKLKESEKLYYLIAQNFPKGTINVFDRDLNYIFVEGEELHKKGINERQLFGTNYIKRLPKEIQSLMREKLMNVFTGNPESFEISLSKGTYQINATPLSSENKQIDKILVVEQNITQQKLVEENMQKALDKERQLNKFKSRFVSMASHEFRTPLSSVLTSSQLIGKYIETDHKEKIGKHLTRIQSSVQHLTSILNDFLSISKLEEGKINISIEEVNLKKIIEDLVDEMQTLSKKDQEIKLNYNGKEKLKIDPSIFKVILSNLVSNAIKYSPEKSVIKVDINNMPDQLKMEVSDQGMGIPKEDQLHLFERFYRAKNVSNISGTGLGLNIVKKYVELFKGEISFESNEQKGTQFFVKIPQGS